MKIDGKKYFIKTLKKKRKLALGGTLPVCPKDDKKGYPPKDGKGDKGDKGDKYKDGKGAKSGSGGVPPKTAKAKADSVAEPAGSDEITCVGSKHYWLKGEGKNADAWALIGPEGKQTRFFATKMSYVKTLRKGSKRPYFRLARAYITAKLNMLSGAPVTPEMERAMAWAEKHFSARRAGYTNVKRVLKAQSVVGKKGKIKKIKKLRKKMIRHAATLRTVCPS